MKEQSISGQPNPEPLRSRAADASIFIGMTSMPLGKEPEFLDKMMKFFDNYRNRAAEVIQSADKFSEKFYRPVAYVLLGSFDLAILALTDDFEFGVQTFNPFDPMWPDGALCDTEGPKNGKQIKELHDAPLVDFDHRVLLGPGFRGKKDMLTLAQETFLGEKRPCAAGTEDGFVPRQPLIGICQVEVNTSFLVGGGADYLRALSKAINSEFANWKTSKEDSSSQLIITGSYTWHELTLLVFSNSFRRIIDFIARVRRMQLIDLGVALCRTWKDQKGSSKCYADEWTALLEHGNVYGLHDAARQGQVPVARLRDWFENPEMAKPYQGAALSDAMKSFLLSPDGKDSTKLSACRGVPPFGTHIFFNTTTNVGFWAGFLKKALTDEKITQALAQPDETCSSIAETAIQEVVASCSDLVLDKNDGNDGKKEGLFLVRRWSAKAGHKASAAAGVCGKNKVERLVVATGRADFFYPCEPPDGTEHLTFEARSSWDIVAVTIEDFVNLRRWSKQVGQPQCLGWCGQKGEQSAGALAANSTVAMAWKPANDEETIPLGHCSADDIRKEFACGFYVINTVYRQLKELRVPKVVMERVLNAIALYNDGILDNFLFSCFLELRPYLTRIIDFIRDQADKHRQGKLEDLAGTVAKLNEMVSSFDTGWRNRFHGGWRLGEISDFNLEFKGGVQQLVSAIHAAYLRLSWCFTHDTRVLATVTGDPKITVQHGVLHMSFFDIFKPEFFAARVGHESSEALLAKPDDDLPITPPDGWLRSRRFVQQLAWVSPQNRPQMKVSTAANLRDRLAKLDWAIGNRQAAGPDSLNELTEAVAGILEEQRSMQEAYKQLDGFLFVLARPQGQSVDNFRAATRLEKQNFLHGFFCEGRRLIGQAPVDKALWDALKHLLAKFLSPEALLASLDQGDHVAEELITTALSSGLTVRNGRNATSETARQAEQLALNLKKYRKVEACKQDLTGLERALNEAAEFVRKYLLRPPSAAGALPRPLRAECLKVPLLESFLNEGKLMLFDQVFADICNFQTVYGGDKDGGELFSYWMLASFVVEPDVWETPTQAGADVFRNMLIRMFLVLGAAPSAKQDETVWTHAEQTVRKYWKQLLELGFVTKEELQKAGLGDEDPIGQARVEAQGLRRGTLAWWFDHAYVLATEPLGLANCWKDRQDFETFLHNGHREYALDAIPGPNDSEWARADLDRWFKDAKDVLRKGEAWVAGRMRPMLREFALSDWRKNEKSPYPYELDRWFDLCETVAVLRAYLSLLKEESEKDAGPIHLAKREPDGSLGKYKIETHARLLFDQRGGTVTFDPEFRRKYFMWRCALIMSLYDISEKAKLIYCCEKPRLLPEEQAEPAAPAGAAAEEP